MWPPLLYHLYRKGVAPIAHQYITVTAAELSSLLLQIIFDTTTELFCYNYRFMFVTNHELSSLL